MNAFKHLIITYTVDDWVIAQVESQEYSNKSEAVNDLICKARTKEQRIEEIRVKLMEAGRSGFIIPDREGMLAEFKNTFPYNG